MREEYVYIYVYIFVRYFQSRVYTQWQCNPLYHSQNDTVEINISLNISDTFLVCSLLQQLNRTRLCCTCKPNSAFFLWVNKLAFLKHGHGHKFWSIVFDILFLIFGYSTLLIYILFLSIKIFQVKFYTRILWYINRESINWYI